MMDRIQCNNKIIYRKGDTLEDKKYLIVCLRNGYWERYEDLVFWGKNRSGYELDLSKAGLYSKEEARNICRVGDCYISIDKLKITKELMEFSHKLVEMRVKKTSNVCSYINTFKRIMRNKEVLKWG